jgi:hypothetical protein
MVIKLKENQPDCDWNMFGQIHPKLGMIFYDLACYLEDNNVKEITITSILRPQDLSSVHAYGRGMDIRADFSPEIRDKATKYINGKYPYNTYSHETCIYHNTGNGWHLHLQVAK